MKKISSKILVAIIGCVLIMSCIVGSLIVVKTGISAKKEAMEKMQALAEVNGKKVNIKFIKAETIVGDLKSNVLTIVDVNKLKTNGKKCEADLAPIIENLSNINSDFMGVYVALNPDITREVCEVFYEDVEGKGVIKRLENDSLMDFNLNNPAMAWYYDAVKAKKGVWSNPYFDQLDEKTAVEMISYSEPVYIDGVLVGVVGIDINYKKYVGTINDIVVDSKGYAFLLNDKFDYIVHNKFTSKDNLLKVEGGKYRKVADEIRKHDSGYIECEYNGEKKILGYAQLTNDWIIVTSIPSKVFFNDIRDGILYAFIAIILGLLVSSRVAIAISRRISRPVVLATHFAEELAKGNLEEKLSITSGDETETLGNSLNKAAENINNLIEELKATEEELIYQVDELVKSEETISVLAYNNPITGVKNRNYMVKHIPDILGKLKTNNQQGALICLDIDNFKMINDTLGHSIGDEFLRKVSTLLQGILNTDHLLCHFGGDEFVCFLPNVENIDEVKVFAEKIFDIFGQAIIANGHEILYTTVSMGISLFPEDGKNFEALFKNADTALNNAKNRGKNTYVIFDKVMNLKVVEKLQLENNLTLAIDNNEFEVYYQPKVDAVTEKVVSMEALVRWTSPILGMVSPAKFIPVAEETGHILSIGEFVLREACRQNKLWHEKGFDNLKVAVNLSAKQLKQKDIVSTISGILEETGLEPQWLEIEITESILMHNFGHTIKILEELKTIGINIYLDDFGTGYSSLNYLRRLPINSIKIDKSFIDGLTIDAKDSFIASSLINLAHGINLSVVAEGVEDLQQLDLLKNYGCDEIQGYYFSKPLNAEDFEVFLEKNS